MANVKTIGGKIVDAAGGPLASKTVTLKNDASGATLTTTTTDANGVWTFANRDETLTYRAEAAFGGSSSQVVVRAPASAEFDHLYANQSFRTAAGATVAIGGAITVPTINGPTVVAGSLNVVGPLNSTAGISTDADIFASGNLQVGGTGNISGALTVVGALTASAGVASVRGTTNIRQLLVDTNAATNEKVWAFVNQDGDLTIAPWNDAENTASTDYLMFTRGTGVALASATFSSAGAELLKIDYAADRVRIGVGTVALPGLTGTTDVDTGITFPGSKAVILSANGGEVARAWLNGANSQFASYATETFIQNRILIGGAMSTAASVTGVIRKIEIRDGAGNPVGWVPVYGAAG